MEEGSDIANSEGAAFGDPEWRRWIGAKSKWHKSWLIPRVLRRFGVRDAVRLTIPEVVARTRVDLVLRAPFSALIWEVKTKDGFRFFLRPFTLDMHFFHEIWDFHIYDPPWLSGLRPEVVIDVGAHIGLFSVYAASKLGATKVISIEPEPSNFHLLGRNIIANGLREVQLLKVAVLGRQRPAELHLDRLNLGAHSVLRKGPETLPILSTTLQEIFHRFDFEVCDLVKMDCEGAELEILGQATNGLLRRIKNFVLEYHLDVYGYTGLSAISERLESAGFDVVVFSSSEKEGMVYASRQNSNNKRSNVL